MSPSRGLLRVQHGSVVDFRIQRREEVVTSLRRWDVLLMLFFETEKYAPKLVCKYISHGKIGTLC